MTRRASALLALMLVAAACTASRPDPTPGPSPAPEPDAPGFTLGVVAATSGPETVTDDTYLDGMRLAVQEVNADGGVGGMELRIDELDNGGDPGRVPGLVRDALERAVAVFLVGPPDAAVELRPEIQAAGKPVFLLGGDLYTAAALFRETFQTGVPLRWQAPVLARYLVRDRRHRRIVAVVEDGPARSWRVDALRDAMVDQGGRLTEVVPLARGGDLSEVRAVADTADALVFAGSPAEAARVSEMLSALADPPQLALTADGLSPRLAASAVPGTVACYPYTWAGWADPIPRVGGFRERFVEAFGRLPAGFAQEGYDAVRLLADALEEDAEDAVRALERLDERTYSALPIRLSPDRRTLIPRDELGLFAVPVPDGERDPWPTDPPDWRALMRTFTSDGRKTNLLEEDREPFFPRWRAPRPSPPFHRSEHGITTRARDDAHH